MTLKEIELETTDVTDQMTNHVIPSTDVLEDVVILTPPQSQNAANYNAESNGNNELSLPVPTPAATILLEVIAPETLPEGYKFNVTVSGSNNIVAVTVPEGGVIAGQRFTTRVENLNDSNKSSDNSNQGERMNIYGKWKDGVCDCFKHGIFHPMVWNACCFTLVAMSQVMTRLKLNWIAIPAKTDKEIKRTFAITVFITVFVLVFNSILGMIMTFEINMNTNEENEITTIEVSPLYEIVNLIRNIINFFSMIYTIYTITKTRLYVREKYSIKGSCFEDCCLSFWCSCCTVAQMARHTTDYDSYPGRCCTSTGLPRSTPSTIIDDDDNNNVVIESNVVDGAVPMAHATIV